MEAFIYKGLEEVGFTEVNPDKGTETLVLPAVIFWKNIQFTEVNPDKGTETISDLAIELSDVMKFTEVNPDKGTETHMNMRKKEERLQVRFTEVNPDKGTETTSGIQLCLGSLPVYRS